MLCGTSEMDHPLSGAALLGLQDEAVVAVLDAEITYVHLDKVKPRVLRLEDVEALHRCQHGVLEIPTALDVRE